MKNTIYAVLVIASLSFGCQETKKNKKINYGGLASPLNLHTGNDNYIHLNKKESIISWQGSSMNGFNTQTGFIHLSKGELLIDKGKLKSGVVEVDMSTIEDKNHESDNELVNHLKDADFFEVDKYPFSLIMITNISWTTAKKIMVTGNLTIKGIKHPVTFPARIDNKNEKITVKGKLTIDRTKWNVRYKSAKFFKNLANQTMSDLIDLEINITAKK